MVYMQTYLHRHTQPHKLIYVFGTQTNLISDALHAIIQLIQHTNIYPLIPIISNSFFLQCDYVCSHRSNRCVCMCCCCGPSPRNSQYNLFHITWISVKNSRALHSFIWALFFYAFSIDSVDIHFLSRFHQFNASIVTIDNSAKKGHTKKARHSKQC